MYTLCHYSLTKAINPGEVVGASSSGDTLTSSSLTNSLTSSAGTFQYDGKRACSFERSLKGLCNLVTFCTVSTVYS